MGLMIALVFIGVFTAVALPLIASSMGPSRSTRQALATLDSAIRSESLVVHKQIIDLRKNEELSSIPWLNKRLHKLELAPYLRNILSQAALSWSPGRLIALSGATLAVPAYIVYFETGMLLPSLAAGIVTGLIPYAVVMFKRSKRFAKLRSAFLSRST